MVMQDKVVTRLEKVFAFVVGTMPLDSKWGSWAGTKMDPKPVVVMQDNNTSLDKVFALQVHDIPEMRMSLGTF